MRARSEGSTIGLTLAGLLAAAVLHGRAGELRHADRTEMFYSTVTVSLDAKPARPGVSAYGARVSFRKSRPLRFPNFVLEYAGERRVRSERYPRGFRIHDFVASRGAERVSVSWSAGTGDIGPALFTIGGKRFALELARSDSLGKLKSDELVILPADRP